MSLRSRAACSTRAGSRARGLLTAGLLVVGLLDFGVTACSSAAPPSAASTASGATAGDPAAVAVTAGFYPLAYLVEQVGGAQVAVTTLAKPGTEPHDLELTPQDLTGLGRARLVVTVQGFQPAVDKAVTQQAAAQAFDVSAAASLDLGAPVQQDGTPNDPGAKDLHFWLDPTRYAAVGRAVADRLAQLDPQHAGDYRTRADAFAASMTSLDAAYRQGLASCASTTLVTSHAAFGYLAQRYHLTQVPIAGLSPDQEPSAKKLAEVRRIVADAGVRTIYAETLVDAKFAQTVAQSSGASVAILDPVEGITSASAGRDYPAVMAANLATLRAGQECR